MNKQSKDTNTTTSFHSHTHAALTALITVTIVLTLHQINQARRAPPRSGTARTDDIAICLTGQVRTFRHNFTSTPILQNLIEPLRHTHNIEIFFIVPVDDDAPTSHTELRQKRAELSQLTNFAHTTVRLIPTHNDLQQAAQYLPPDNSTKGDRVHVPSTCASPQRHTLPFPHALYRGMQCLRSIKRRERKRGRKFGWVYRSRLDLIPLDAVPLPRDLITGVYYSNQAKPNVTAPLGKYWQKTRGVRTAAHVGISDQMCMCSREVAEVMLKAYDMVSDCESFELMFPVRPETLLRFWLLKHNFSSVALPFDHVLVREKAGPECKRLYFLRGVGVDWKQSIRKCYLFAQKGQHLFPNMVDTTKAIDRFMHMTRPESDVTSP